MELAEENVTVDRGGAGRGGARLRLGGGVGRGWSDGEVGRATTEMGAARAVACRHDPPPPQII